MKVCTGCNIEKRHDEFGLKNGKEHTRCKTCVNKKCLEYNHKKGICKKYKHEPKNDLCGKKVNHFLVLKDLGTKDKQRYWLCECECGVIKEISHNQIASGRTKSCGCKIKGSNNALWQGHGEISAGRWDTIKRKRRHSDKREFSITIEEVWDLYIKQNKVCALSGLPIEFGKTNKDKYTASLDRIDSHKGYTLDNVQWVHKDINRMKNIYSQERFVEICKLVSSYSSIRLRD
jgi:hypothetical protein